MPSDRKSLPCAPSQPREDTDVKGGSPHLHPREADSDTVPGYPRVSGLWALGAGLQPRANPGALVRRMAHPGGGSSEVPLPPGAAVRGLSTRRRARRRKTKAKPPPEQDLTPSRLKGRSSYRREIIGDVSRSLPRVLAQTSQNPCHFLGDRSVLHSNEVTLDGSCSRDRPSPAWKFGTFSPTPILWRRKKAEGGANGPSSRQDEARVRIGVRGLGSCVEGGHSAPGGGRAPAARPPELLCGDPVLAPRASSPGSSSVPLSCPSVTGKPKCFPESRKPG